MRSSSFFFLCWPSGVWFESVCFLSSLAVTNAWPQRSSLHTCGRSPVWWRRMWVWRLLEIVAL